MSILSQLVIYPQNPVELLMHPRFEELIKIAKDTYARCDYYRHAASISSDRC